MERINLFRKFPGKPLYTKETVEPIVIAISMLMQLYNGDTEKVTKFLMTENPLWFLERPFDLLIDGKSQTIINYLQELLGWE